MSVRAGEAPADVIQEDVINRLVAAGWIYWKGGALDVTPQGALIAEGLRLGPQPAASSSSRTLRKI